jgi:hypothetical protein
MRQLTLKDILSFYTPCLNCGNQINLSWCVNKGSINFSSTFSPTLDGKMLIIDLKTTYYNKFSLMIDIASHSFISSNSAELVTYVADTECYLNLRCFKCNSELNTSQLIFDLSRRTIKPLTIKNEMWYLKDDEYLYSIYTDIYENTSNVFVHKNKELSYTPVWQKRLDALPINKFENKEKFLEKLQTFITFS